MTENQASPKDDQQPDAVSPQASPSSPFEYDEDYTEVYANNVYHEVRFWDLKLTFGEVDYTDGKSTVVLSTAITIPWAQAKLMALYLQANILLYESEHGKIKIPRSMANPPVRSESDTPERKAALDHIDDLIQEMTS